MTNSTYMVCLDRSSTMDSINAEAERVWSDAEGAPFGHILRQRVGDQWHTKTQAERDTHINHATGRCMAIVSMASARQKMRSENMAHKRTRSPHHLSRSLSGD